MKDNRKNPVNKLNKDTILSDYRLANLSRILSVTGRREVLSGKAKFGIFGDGKEIIQLALAKQFRDGDWRSGYYRDQTWMMAMGMYNSLEFFHQLYGSTNADERHGSGGRVFNNHFAVPNINPDGSWLDLTKQKNSSADISPTAGQMPRLLGLAYASKLFRQNKELHGYTSLSLKGNEVAFGSIGDASTSEVISGKRLTQPAFCRYLWPSQFTTMAMGFQFRRSTRQQKEAFPIFSEALKVNPDGPVFTYLRVKDGIIPD
jgi:TPP-dependent pyruvate/acetoin dehydrogenase alpha subunit